MVWIADLARHQNRAAGTSKVGGRVDVTKDINEIRLTGSITDATARDYEVRKISLTFIIAWSCFEWARHCMHESACVSSVHAARLAKRCLFGGNYNNTHAMLAGCSMGARLHRHSREEAQRCVLLQSSPDFSAGQGCATVRGQSGGRTVRIRCRCS